MAFCWKFCGNMKAVLFGLLLLFFILTEAKNCYYFENLKTGKTYYAYNPKYPSANEGPLDCNWEMTSPYSIKIDCNIFIPTYGGKCGQDILSVKFAHGEEHKYCGNGEFTLKGRNATIRLNISKSQKSSFICKIQTEESFDENNCKCGWKKVTRIVGGNETGVNEYPMMCGLVDSTLKIIYCGCTIISQQYVLTAAHCIDRRDITKIGVVVGEHNVTTGNETKATELFRVDKCIMHPYYYESNNDIAVCKLIGTIKYSAEVGPVCLPFQHSCDSFDGDIVTVLGWGLLDFGGRKSDTLQKVNLNAINLQKCKEYYPDITKDNMCTFTPGKDACQMDSGGPVLWQNPITRNFVSIGIISSGFGCASNEPAVNTCVSAFLPWIKSVTPGVQYCEKE